jgi:hypothetical protein
LRIAHPALLVLNTITGFLLRPFKIDTQRSTLDPLDREELRTVVKEAGALIPQKHRDMLFGILDLEDVTVEDIMVPRADIVAIDLDKPWVDVAEQLKTCRHTRVPCYRTSLEQIVAFRIMQGAAGAALVPLSQVVLLQEFPRERGLIRTRGRRELLRFSQLSLHAQAPGPRAVGHDERRLPNREARQFDAREPTGGVHFHEPQPRLLCHVAGVIEPQPCRKQREHHRVVVLRDGVFPEVRHAEAENG